MVIKILNAVPETSYPDDPFNRYWQSFTDANPVVECHVNISSLDFWNFLPAAALTRALTTSRGQELIINWPPFDLPDTSYYLALYFQDNRTPSPLSWRVFDVAVNGKAFYNGLNVSTEGVMVYGSQWPLSGKTNITLTPAFDSPVGPLINAGELFQIVPLAGRTLTRDSKLSYPNTSLCTSLLSFSLDVLMLATVISMETIARSLTNPPPDWKGDPCLPMENSWTGVTCNFNGSFARVVTM